MSKKPTNFNIIIKEKGKTPDLDEFLDLDADPEAEDARPDPTQLFGLKEKLDNITSMSGDVIVKVDTALVEDISHGELQLKLDPTHNIYKNRKIAAQVVSVPKHLPGAVFYEDDEGYPKAMKQNNWDRELGKGMYYPTTHQDKYVTAMDQKIKVQKGDVVHFHYGGLAPNNYIAQDSDGMNLYRISYEKLFCTQPAYLEDKYVGAPEFLNGWIAVEPYYGDGYEEIKVPELTINGKETGNTRTIKAKMMGNIVYDMAETPLFQQGIVAGVGDPIPSGKPLGFQEGDRILYRPNSDFQNTIMGRDYFMMKQWDVIAKIGHESFFPVRDWVLVDMQPVVSNIILLENSSLTHPEEGWVTGVGSGCEQDLQVGDKVRFHYNKNMILQVPGMKGGFMQEKWIMYRYER